MLKITPALIDAFAKNLTEREYSPATIATVTGAAISTA